MDKTPVGAITINEQGAYQFRTGNVAQRLWREQFCQRYCGFVFQGKIRRMIRGISHPASDRLRA